MFNKDYILRGKHATYAKNLCQSNEKLQKGKSGISVFRYGIDLIQIAPLIGMVYGESKEIDKESSDRYTIQANAVIAKENNLETIYRLLMLTDGTGAYTSEEKISMAFKENEDEIKSQKNMKIFDNYVRGGIEWLHSVFTTNSTTEEDYLNDIKLICNQYKVDFPDTNSWLNE
jgi:hypothetical protein